MSSRTRRGFRPVRDLPTLLWLLAVLVVSLVHPLVPAPRWLLLHLLLLGAVSHSILVWSRHFAEAVLHAVPRDTDRRHETARLLLLNGGTVLVVAGVVCTWWPLTVVGATGVATAAAWHGVALVQLLRRSLPARFGTTVRYYIAASALLPLGATLGTLLARGHGGSRHEQLLVAHVVINLLGWVGLTVVGTLVTLWPTMLRTRMVDGAERATQRALPLLLVAVVGTTAAAVLGFRTVTAVGILGYLASLVLVARPFIATARRKPPASFPTWSVLAGTVWLLGCLVALAAGVGTASGWEQAEQRVSAVTPFLGAGFAAQVLFGALSYLVPSVLGGGPAPVRAANAVVERAGALRVVLVNTSLLVCVLPLHGAVRVLASTLALVGLASFVPLLRLAIWASRRARQAPAADIPPTVTHPRAPVWGQVAAAVATVALAVAVGAAFEAGAPAEPSADEEAGHVMATGETTTVRVVAGDMRFTPSTIHVPAGNRLVVELTNRDAAVHDLVLDTGKRSGRLSPAATTRIEVGVVAHDLEGWCSVLGHRRMGMVLHIRTGPAPAPTAAAVASPAHDARLQALSPERVHRRTLTVREVEREVAPGVTQRLWTYDGSAPGPVLHGRVGDLFEITLVNAATIGHSIDFHAGALAPDQPMRTLPPGGSLLYRFRATRAGVWMYHCSTMPMSAHIANGMYGAVVIEPPGLPAVDRSYLLVQSELYLGPHGGPVDVPKLMAEKPDLVVFNGVANQYDDHPLTAQVGERVRVWVLDAGPNRSSAFHVVGAQFDTTYLEGGYLLERGTGGSQSLALAPSQGGFVELSFPEAGRYPFVSHVMVDAERGAHGAFRVSVGLPP